MPLTRRIPKRGFNNIFRKEYIVVNVCQLEMFEANTEITLELLLENGVVNALKGNAGLKVLGDGSLTKPLKVKAEKFSAKAVEAIQNAGGTIEVIG